MISLSQNSENTQFSKVLKLSKKYLVALLLLGVTVLGVPSVYAEMTITGTVSDSDSKKTLPFISVSIGPTTGTTTDDEGKYSIKDVEDGAELEFSSTGYTSQTITVNEGDSKIDVKLEAKDEQLEEVVVSAKRINNTIKDNSRTIKGKVQTLSGDPIENIKINIKEISSIIKDIEKSISSLEKLNNEALTKEAKKAKKELADFNSLTEEIKGEYYITTNKEGEFELKSKLIPNGSYTISFVDFSDKYKPIKSKEYGFKKGELVLDLGTIQMYTNCENTGGRFDADCLFPAWATENDKQESSRQEIRGIYGKNQDGKVAFHLIPNIINIILKFISPIVVVMFIYAGFLFIYAGSDEEDLNKAKDFFLYAGIGLAFIIMSYTLMKVIYFFLK